MSTAVDIRVCTGTADGEHVWDSPTIGEFRLVMVESAGCKYCRTGYIAPVKGRPDDTTRLVLDRLAELGCEPQLVA